MIFPGKYWKRVVLEHRNHGGRQCAGRDQRRELAERMTGHCSHVRELLLALGPAGKACDEDRPLSNDIARVTEAIRAGSFDSI